ncbi:MAG: NAD(P)-dependent oxidoreductase [Leptospiraceae bacterium]|nr:NAD(P)-dependent oxidoreductase [Leptospiraceae bacterium]
MKKTITFIGTGAMAFRIARRMIASGHTVVFFNRTENHRVKELSGAGAKYCTSPQEAIQGSEVIVSMLSDDRAVEKVWLDENNPLYQKIQPNQILIEMSTLSVAFSSRLQNLILNADCNLLLTPVVGTLPQAEQGILLALVSGDEKLFEKYQNTVQELAGKTRYCGNSVEAAKIKLSINTLLAVQTAAFSELFETLHRNNIPEFYDLFSSLPITSPAMKILIEQMKANNFESMFPINLVAKDLRYASEFIESSGVQSRLTKSGLQTFDEAVKNGLGDLNISGIIRLFES